MKFRLGINYWPVRHAMHWWQRFDAGEVADDFVRIKQAGFDCVRIFLLWEDCQPTPDSVRVHALADLVTVAELARQHGLAIVPTLFTGHMSGVNWIPGWALGSDVVSQRFRVVAGDKVASNAIRNWYTDSEVTETQVLLAREAASALSGHEALWAWDLGNENSNCVVPPSREAAKAWVNRMTETIRAKDPRSAITIGLHMEDLEEDRHLGPVEASAVCDFLSMHAYPMYASWARHATDTLVVPFLGLVTQWLGRKDVLLEEFGAPTVPRREPSSSSGGPIALLDEEAAASFLRRSLNLLHAFGFIGGFAWCYADYDETLWREPPFDQAPHERHFGLWRTDGSEKPGLWALQQITTANSQPVLHDFRWVDMDAEEFYLNPKMNLERLYQNFVEESDSADRADGVPAARSTEFLLEDPNHV